jgi:hypothetical protein
VVKICEGDEELWGPEDVSCIEDGMVTTDDLAPVQRPVDSDAAHARFSRAAALVVDVILEAGQRREFEFLQLQLVDPLEYPLRSVEGVAGRHGGTCNLCRRKISRC